MKKRNEQLQSSLENIEQRYNFIYSKRSQLFYKVYFYQTTDTHDRKLIKQEYIFKDISLKTPDDKYTFLLPNTRRFIMHYVIEYLNFFSDKISEICIERSRIIDNSKESIWTTYFTLVNGTKDEWYMEKYYIQQKEKIPLRKIFKWKDLVKDTTI